MAAGQNNLARKLTIIPASQRPEDITLRVAAYCRVSSSSEDQLNSFAAQNTYYTSLISSKENWTLVDIYSDEGITGTSAEKREDFQRLMNDCRKGLIDKVLTKSISRFARNTKDCLNATRELKALGIGVVFEEQHIDTSIVTGEMLTAVFASCAQTESESISKNVRWGIQKRMQNGTFLPSHQPFGYEIIDGQICIQAVQAQYVCEIFQMYLAGISAYRIADYLNKQQSTCPELQNYTWTYKAITRILRNEKYTGNSLWQKTYRTETLPRKEYPNRGNVDQYSVSDTHPAIITADAFAQVQKLLDQRKSARGSSSGENPYLGRMECGCCGGNMRSKTVRDIRYLVCRRHAEDRSACGQLPIAEAEVEQAFLRLYYQLKHSGNAILSDLADDLNTIRERQMLWSPDVIALNQKISSITSQSHRLTLLNQQGAVDPDIFIRKSNQLAEQLHKAKREKGKILEQRDDYALQKTYEIMEILEYGPDFLDTFDAELFRELVDKIIVDSNERIRFRLVNGLELPERIERTVR